MPLLGLKIFNRESFAVGAFAVKCIRNIGDIRLFIHS